MGEKKFTDQIKKFLATNHRVIEELEKGDIKILAE